MCIRDRRHTVAYQPRLRDRRQPCDRRVLSNSSTDDTRKANGAGCEQQSIYAENGELLGDFQVQTSKSYDSVSMTVRAIRTLPTTRLPNSSFGQLMGRFEDGSIRVGLDGATREQTQTKQVGVLLFAVTITSNDREAAPQIDVQVKLLAQSEATAK